MLRANTKPSSAGFSFGTGRRKHDAGPGAGGRASSSALHSVTPTELKSGATVLDVLALAGGLSEFSARSRIVIMRTESGKVTRIPFNYNKVTAAGGEHGNLRLEPGDIVLVP